MPDVAATEMHSSRTVEAPARRGRWPRGRRPRSPLTVAVPGDRRSIMLALVCCPLAITACGGSSKLTVSGGGRSASLVSFTVCMRSHGVSNLPDPGASSNGGGVSILPGGINPSAPAFKTAWAACATLLPGLGAHHGPSAQATEQTLRFSECMRSHGVTGFPDPTATPPSGFDPMAATQSSHREYRAVIRRGGAWLAIPATINTTSPTYQYAAAACRFGPKFS